MKERRKEGYTGFRVGLTGTLDLPTRGTTMVMMSKNSSALLFMPASVDGGEKSCNTIKQVAA